MQLYDLQELFPLQSCWLPPTVQEPSEQFVGEVNVSPSQLPVSHCTVLFVFEQMKLAEQVSFVQTFVSSQSVLFEQHRPAAQQKPLVQCDDEH